MQTSTRRCGIFLSVLMAISVSATGQEKSSIIKLDPSLDSIVSSDAKVELLAGEENFDVIEGPLWVRKGGFLIFSDMPRNVIHKWDPKSGKISTFLEKSGFTGTDPTDIGSERHHGDKIWYYIGSNGITMDRQGRIVFSAMGDRQIVRLEPDGRRTVLASRYEGKRLNGTNDLVYKSNGTLYFTDPTTGLRKRDEDPKKELPFNGVFMLKDDKVILLIKDLPGPNGVALSTDEKYLYVTDSSKTVRRYDVQPDDTVANGRVFIDMTPELSKAPGVPDGLKVDQKGNLYSTGPGGVWVISPEGKHLGTILVPGMANNIAFGDGDGKSLFAAGRTGLYRVRVKIPGVHP